MVIVNEHDNHDRQRLDSSLVYIGAHNVLNMLNDCTKCWHLASAMSCQTLSLVFWHRKSLQQRNYRYILNVRFFLLIDSIVKCRLFYDYFIASLTGCSNTVYVGISVFPLKYEPAQVININLYITINHVAITLNLFVRGQNNTVP